MKMNFEKNFRSGFTIIELVMVMAIIGVLAGALVMVIPRGTERARDTHRKSDLAQYQAALELYANKNNGYYPRRPQTSTVDTAFCINDLGLTSGLCPSDPRDGSTNCNDGTLCRYFYQSNNQSCGAGDGSACATGYIIWTGLEMPSDPLVNHYWVVCSDGRAGEVPSLELPPGSGDEGSCPL